MADYEVGYCKPLKHTQFKKGKSGNPKGRPKGSVNMATVLHKTLSATVAVGDDQGKRKIISKMEAAVRRLVDEAIDGDMHAFRVLSLLTQALQNPESGTEHFESTDREIMQTLVKRLAVASSA